MRKIIIVSLVAISLSLFSTPAMSYATSPKLSERDLAEYLKHNSPTRIIEPRYLGNDEPGRGSLQGETAVLLTESSSKSPTLYGAIPSWCDDVSVIVFPDTANIETGDGLYLYSGLLTDDAIYEDLKVWQLDLQEAGLGLINGKYNVYVAACLEDGVGGEPLYSDIFYDKVFVPDHNKLAHAKDFATGTNVVLEKSRLGVAWIEAGIAAGSYEAALKYCL